MKNTTKKVISVFLSALMIFTLIPTAFAAHETDGSYGEYKQFLKKHDVSELNGAQLFSALFDYLDEDLSALDDEDKSINIGAPNQDAIIDVSGLCSIINSSATVMKSGVLGGDWDKIDFTAFGDGVTRENGDLALVYQLIDFAADNAALISTLIGNGFDFGTFLIEVINEESVYNPETGTYSYICSENPEDWETISDLLGECLDVEGLLNKVLDMLLDEMGKTLDDQYTIQQWLNTTLNYCFDDIIEVDTGLDFTRFPEQIDITTQSFYNIVKNIIFSFIKSFTDSEMLTNLNLELQDVAFLSNSLPEAFQLYMIEMGNEIIGNLLYEQIGEDEAEAYFSSLTPAIPVDDSLFAELAYAYENHLIYENEYTGTYKYNGGLYIIDTTEDGQIDNIRDCTHLLDGTTYTVDDGEPLKLYWINQHTMHVDNKAAIQDTMFNDENKVGVTVKDYYKEVYSADNFFKVDGQLYFVIFNEDGSEGININYFPLNEYTGFSKLLKDTPVLNPEALVSSDELTYTGIIAQLNHIIYGAINQLLSDELIAALDWSDGDNTNIITNINKALPVLCDKINILIKFATGEDIDNYLNQVGINADDIDNGVVCIILNLLKYLSSAELPKAIEATSLAQLAAMWCVKFTEYTAPNDNEFFGAFNFGAKVYDASGALLKKTDTEWKEICFDIISEWGIFCLSYISENDYAKLLFTMKPDEIVDKCVNDGWGYEECFDEITDWALSFVDGLIPAFDNVAHESGVLDGGGAFEKLSLILDMLPLGLINGCESENHAFDCGVFVNKIVDAVLGLDLASILDMFTVNSSDKNYFYGNDLYTAALIMVQRLINGILPGTITDDMLAENYNFLSNTNLRKITVNLINSVNNRKTYLVPTIMILLNKIGLFYNLINKYIYNIYELPEYGTITVDDENRRNETTVVSCKIKSTPTKKSVTFTPSEGKALIIRYYYHSSLPSQYNSYNAYEGEEGQPVTIEIREYYTDFCFVVANTDGSTAPFTAKMEKQDYVYSFGNESYYDDELQQYVYQPYASLIGYFGDSTELVVPDTTINSNGEEVNVTSVSFQYTNQTRIEKLTLGKNIRTFYSNYEIPALKEIAVDEDNAYFTAVDGILYNKDITSLNYYPAAKEDTEYTIPNTLTIINGIGAIKYAKNLTKILIPADSNLDTYAAAYLSYAPNVESYEVFNSDGVATQENYYYYVIDGVLYYKYYDSYFGLISYPAAKAGDSFTVNDANCCIDSTTFAGVSKLKTLNFEKVKWMNDCCTDSHTSITEIRLGSPSYTINYSRIPINATVYGYEKTQMQKNCIDANIPFVPVSEITDEGFNNKLNYNIFIKDATCHSLYADYNITYSDGNTYSYAVYLGYPDVTTAGTKTGIASYYGAEKLFTYTVFDKVTDVYRGGNTVPFSCDTSNDVITFTADEAGEYQLTFNSLNQYSYEVVPVTYDETGTASSGYYYYSRNGNLIFNTPTLEAGGKYFFKVYGYYSDACLLSCSISKKAAHTHSFAVDGEPVSSTCCELGYTDYKCTVDGCNESYRIYDTVYAPHNYIIVSDTVITAPDCRSSGVNERILYCETCNNTNTVSYETEKTEHNWVKNYGYPATCTQPGHTDYYHCDKCGLCRNYQYIPAKGHTPAEPVEENVVAATCYAEGSYDEVVYCSVEDCGAELSRTTKTIDKTAHTPAAAVQEKVVAATCYATGSYDEVVYCSVEDCKAELSRTTKTIDKTAHTPAEPVEENVVAATCYATGSYDEVVYCSVEDCKVELSRTQKTIDKTAHTPAEPVEENVVAATCYAEGSYDEVVYCSVEDCKAELSRTQKTIDKTAHTPAEPVKENVVAATCDTDGSYDEVVYCSVEDCGAELNRTHKTIAKTGHTPAAAVQEKVVAATCYATGSYDEVVYCSVEDCGAEISRTHKTIAKTAHTPAASVQEKVVAATCYATGSYDEVVYCSVKGCGAELSRTHKTIAKTAHTPAAAVHENYVAATCSTDGGYDEVIYCSVNNCRAEVSRKHITESATNNHVDSNGDNTCDNCGTVIDNSFGARIKSIFQKIINWFKNLFKF